MYVKAGAYGAAGNEIQLSKALEILRAENDGVGARAVEAALARAKKAHDAAYTPEMMQWARIGTPESRG